MMYRHAARHMAVQLAKQQAGATSIPGIQVSDD